MRRSARAVALGLALALALAACDSGEEPETDDQDVEEEDGDEEEDGEDGADGEGAQGPFRLGWALAYASPQYAMEDLYACDAASNNFGYCNEEFDSALQEANASSGDEATELYHEAEDILLEDLPMIPMWYSVYTTVHTDNVENIVVDPSTYVRAELVEAEGDEFSLHGCEPQALLPQMSNEVCGGRVLGQLFSGLTEIDPETSEAEPMVAESIEANDDFTEYTITLRDDFTFHDGSPVTASSFVDAWNFAADPDNGMANAPFFSLFDGYEEMQSGDADQLEGLEAVDETTIEISLSEPFAPLEAALSHQAYYPLPEVAYEDMEAFESAPVGNGRYQMDGEWEREVQVALQRYEDWPGETPGSAQNITFAIYSDVNTAYLDVQAGELDILEQVPPEQLVNVDDDFGDNVVRTDTSSFTYLGFPMYNEDFGDNPELRKALSLAVDREEIIDAIFDGAMTPASSVIPPNLSEYRDDACDYCEFDEERAQELFEEAGGWDGTMTIYYNSGAGHEEWVEAVSNQWREVLGIEDFEFESLEFAQYLELLDAGVS